MKKVILLIIFISLLSSCSIFKKEEKIEEDIITIKSEKIDPVGGKTIGIGNTTVSELKTTLDFNN